MSLLYDNTNGERYSVVHYDLPGTAKAPFEQWLDRLFRKDKAVWAVVEARITRLRRGNFGNHRNVGKGVWELKISIGPGVRVYYSVISKRTVLLLCGGKKGFQRRDIETAKRYLKEYKTRDEKDG